MSWHKWIRQSHRWLAVAFTLSVILVAVVVPGQGENVVWVVYLPLLPLALLTFSGLYLFVLPYATRRRSGRRLAQGG